MTRALIVGLTHAIAVTTVMAVATGCRNKVKRASKAPIVSTTVVESASKVTENRPSLKLSDVGMKYSSLNRPWETFSAKFKANYQDSGRSLSFVMTCRSQRSKATHLLVQGPFGILVAEVLVRPDSFYLDNRFEKTFTKGPSTAGAAFSGLPLDFNLLQTLVTGIPTLEESAFSRIDSSGGLFRFQMTPDNREMTYAGMGSFPSTIYLNGKEQTAVISLSEPKPAEGIAEEVPWTKKLALGNPQGRELLSLTLHNQSSKFNQPVEVPDRLVARSGAKVVELR